MKRQPIASAAAFFVLHPVQVESHGELVESVWKPGSVTDAIFLGRVLY